MSADRIVEMLTDREAKKWQREAGRPEIDAPHIPLSWVPLAMVLDLRAAIDAGLVTLVDLPRRAAPVDPNRPNPNRTATFIVKVTP